MKPLVIDASVALKWYLSDEEEGMRALEILDGHVSGGIELHAPALLEFEMANGLTIAARRARVSAQEIATAMEGFLEIGIELHPIAPYIEKVFDFTKRYGITAYDAAYAALAAELGTSVITADRRLFEAAGEAGCIELIGK